MIRLSAPAMLRAVSMSSMRSSQRPLCARASSQLASAAISEPKCSGPLGEGAKRPIVGWGALKELVFLSVIYT